MKKYLPKLSTFDDLNIEEWRRKAMNSEEEFKVTDSDSKVQANQKESLQRWFSLARFSFEVKHFFTDKVTDPQVLSARINEVLNGKASPYFDFVAIPQDESKLRTLVGTDVDAFVSNKDKSRKNVIFIRHPSPEKNYNLDKQFEEYAAKNKEMLEKQNVTMSVFNGINEAETFKNPSKLPAVLMFQKKEKQAITKKEVESKDLLKSVFLGPGGLILVNNHIFSRSLDSLLQ